MGTMKGVNMISDNEEAITRKVPFKKVHKSLMETFIDTDTRHYMCTLDHWAEEDFGQEDCHLHKDWESAKKEIIGFRKDELFALIFNQETKEHYVVPDTWVD